VEVWTPGSELTDWQRDLMQKDRAIAAVAYEALTGVPADVSRRPELAASGAQTGAQEPETPQESG
jgi:hypothetical protein